MPAADLSSLTTTTEGSSRTIPFPLTYISVLAVPKSIEISVEKAQKLRTEQTIICSEASLISSKEENSLVRKVQTKKIDHIKVVDFDKEKMNEKIRNKMMEKRGMKNIKVRFFN